ncbi:hypothetical protein RUE5091_03623 [Ruegeria denitrificans]|uniref:Uncharacterized protein n=1 Tax=Ruegeria denitrificans TaxID=1715692 RepID=A0A0P1IHP2_9RHOB|nr:hypothetical protein RUE5091_03623 [Ruegeria denitrificans]
MIGLPFVHYSTRILHSIDLDDMQTAILSGDDVVSGGKAPKLRSQKKVSPITFLSEEPESYRIDKQ